MSNSANIVLKVFSARACAAPLEKAVELFQRETGIAVQVSVCNRHCASMEAEEASGSTGGDDFLKEIDEAGIHDMAIGGAEYLLDDGEVRGIVLRGQRRSIALRRSALLVPAGNPAHIEKLADVARPGVRVGVSVLDCLKGAWEDVCGRAGILDAVRKNISFYANGCIAIVESVAQGKVDVAFGWASFTHLEGGRIKIMPLPNDQAICRGTCIGMLRFCRQPEAARRFMDFLTTPPARACYRQFGWEA
jgi:accessory colonization factor AcfC